MPERNDQHMLTLYRRLFSELEQQGAEYAIWKNVQELPEALQGSGDIDLYVYPAAHTKFVEILKRLRFVRATSHKSYPCVEHYYGFDAPSGNFAHLHIYFRLVTGESHIKQYVVPIESYLDDYPAVCNAQGIYELHPLLLKKLNIFRRKIKLSCLPGAILFFRERRGYQQEKELTHQTLHAADSSSAHGSTLSRPDGWLGDVEESATLFGEVLDGFRYRYRYQQWNRFRPMLTPLHRYSVIFARLHGKLVKRKKVFPIGLIVAISYSDECDVTRHESELAERSLAKHFSVRRLTVDQPDSAVAALRACAGGPSLPNGGQSNTDFSAYQAMRLLWEAWRWRSRVRRTVYWSTAGFVVIWNPVEVEQVRQALAVVSSVNTRASPSMQRLLRACTLFFRAEPLSDTEFIVTPPGISTLSRANETSATSVTLRARPDASAHGRALPVSTGLSSDGNLADTCGETGSKGRQQLNTALWEAIAKHQY